MFDCLFSVGAVGMVVSLPSGVLPSLVPSVSERSSPEVVQQTRRDFFEQSLFAAAAASLARACDRLGPKTPPSKKKGAERTARMACDRQSDGRGAEHIHEFGNDPQCESGGNRRRG